MIVMSVIKIVYYVFILNIYIYIYIYIYNFIFFFSVVFEQKLLN
jgi:hypothetical protein